MQVELSSSDIVVICMALREEARKWAPGSDENNQMMVTLEKLQDLNLLEDTKKDTRPHSRACGPRAHEHGMACHNNCPTCGGK